MTAQGTGKERGSEGPIEPKQGSPVEPWYRIAQEAAQILVSTLALYASMRAFLEKMKKRRYLTRIKEV